MGKARIGLHHRRLQRGNRGWINIIGQMPGLGGKGMTAPAILNLFFQRNRIEAKRQNRSIGLKRLGQAIGRQTSLFGVWIGQPVQGLRQGQAVFANLGAQPGQGLVEQAGPVGNARRAVNKQALKIGAKLKRPRQAHAPEPRAPTLQRRIGAQGRLNLPFLKLVQL